MNCLGKIALSLAGGLMLAAPVRAATPAPAPVPEANPSSDNPYSVIAARNIFGLVPPPAPPAPPPPENNLPKIVPQGIMGVNGNYQVLFKVAPLHPEPGQKDDYYILSEGQMQDEIEVVKIDDQKSMVTFDNHGTTQVLPLVEAKSSGGSGSGNVRGGSNPVTLRPGAPTPGGNATHAQPVRFGTSSAFSNHPGSENPSGANGQPGSGGPGGLDFNANTQGRIYQPPASSLTPEQAQLILVTQHLKAQKEGDPTAPLFPPSVIDRQVGITPNTSDPSQ